MTDEKLTDEERVLVARIKGGPKALHIIEDMQHELQVANARIAELEILAQSRAERATTNMLALQDVDRELTAANARADAAEQRFMAAEDEIRGLESEAAALREEVERLRANSRDALAEQLSAQLAEKRLAAAEEILKKIGSEVNERSLAAVSEPKTEDQATLSGRYHVCVYLLRNVFEALKGTTVTVDVAPENCVHSRLTKADAKISRLEADNRAMKNELAQVGRGPAGHSTQPMVHFMNEAARLGAVDRLNAEYRNRVASTENQLKTANTKITEMQLFNDNAQRCIVMQTEASKSAIKEAEALRIDRQRLLTALDKVLTVAEDSCIVEDELRRYLKQFCREAGLEVKE